MASSIVAEKLARKEFFAAPGIQDMNTAVVANRVGFDVVYGSGYWLTASCHGLPDAGLASYTQMVDRMSTLVRTSHAAVIADADTGYGGLLNVDFTVRGYEAAGVTAIQLEDQEFPKKCGHTPFKRVIPAEDMARKIRVARAARSDSKNFLIIARTDARASEGIDGALRRLDLYARAGADVLFFEAPHSIEEMARGCAAFDLPMVANMAHGGKTPILPAAQLQELGFAFAIYPALASLAAAHAAEKALLSLKRGGDGTDVPLFDFNDFCRLIGFERVWDFERQWPEQ